MMQKLCVKNLYASYNNCEILKNVSLELSSGEFICICGPNGAGKSTFLSLMCGINEGNLKITQANQVPSIINDSKIEIISELKPKERAKKIAFMAQNENSVWDYSVKDIVITGRFPYSNNGHYSKDDEKMVKEVLEELEIQDLINRKVHSLSGGEFQKVRIARALCQNPDFILFDEPASNLDFVYEPALMNSLKNIAKNKKIGMLLSVHNINIIVKYADKVLFLPAKGDSIFGKTEEIFNIENLKKTYGVDFICKETKSFQSL